MSSNNENNNGNKANGLNYGVSVLDFPDSTVQRSPFATGRKKKISKSDKSTLIDPDYITTASEWIEHINFELKYNSFIDNSTILPQCINAYKSNIAGFGLAVRYKEDYKGKEKARMVKEFKFLESVLDKLTDDFDSKNLFEQLVDDVESVGIGYLEVIRDNEGKVVELVNIFPVDSITKSKKDTDYTEYEYIASDGSVITKNKRFRKYRQQIGDRCVYFKEMNDPRVMDCRTGRYINENETLELKYVANEILEFKNSKKPYGDVRWIGCMLPIIGSWHAESLNLNYFKNGRHTPLAICVENGRLSQESMEKLQEYTSSIRGENSQHAFLIIQTEPIASEVAWNKENPPKVTLKDMASILQKDELFGEYNESNRKKVQSAFTLPDIYVGYTTDFNRATAYAAMTVTEQQVFQPYRNRLNWIINHKLLNEYNLQYCEVYFKSPDFKNPDDVKTILDATGSLGGISANMAKEIACEQLNRDCNDYDFEGADYPLSIAAQLNNANNIVDDFDKSIEKANKNGDDDIIPILKSLKEQFEQIAEEYDSDEEQ